MSAVVTLIKPADSQFTSFAAVAACGSALLIAGT